jgi:hypothetical protein
MIREVIRAKRANTIRELFSVAIETPGVLVDCDTSVVHLDLQVTIVYIVPVNRGVFADTPLSEGIFGA